ncbi:MAG: LL-diaminopimelate aminotransferase [Deltaproteobacteria bacterium]|nr:LL-diaminopimelate aminotransferase [Deltaproteobacteria bacterium]
MQTFAQRIKDIPPYLFVEIDRIKQAALDKGVDIIDLGVGDPDLPTPGAVINRLIESTGERGFHNYPFNSGLPGLRLAFAEWFKGRFGVSLDPNDEVLPLIGSKEGIGHIYFGYMDPGDEVLIPDPGYPVYAAGAILAGAVPRYFPLRRENNFLPRIDELEKMVTPRTRMLWLNYPSNPTAAVASLEFFEEISQFAAERGILICQDMAYSEITFGGRKAVSLLQTSKGNDAGVEFHSLSKTFCMTGWRVGFAVGKAEAIESLAKVKTNLDSGIFIPIQKAAETALLYCQKEAKEIVKTFEARQKMFVAGLNEIGWTVPMPEATFYVWAPVPKGFDSMSFCAYLMEETGIVCTPGVGFGNYGEGFIRMSLTIADDRLREALERMSKLKVKWVFK